jgi:hypothetical protein
VIWERLHRRRSPFLSERNCHIQNFLDDSKIQNISCWKLPLLRIANLTDTDFDSRWDCWNISKNCGGRIVFFIYPLYSAIFTSKIQLLSSNTSLDHHFCRSTLPRSPLSGKSFSLSDQIWILEIRWRYILSFHVCSTLFKNRSLGSSISDVSPHIRRAFLKWIFAPHHITSPNFNSLSQETSDHMTHLKLKNTPVEAQKKLDNPEKLDWQWSHRAFPNPNSNPGNSKGLVKTTETNLFRATVRMAGWRSGSDHAIQESLFDSHLVHARFLCFQVSIIICNSGITYHDFFLSGSQAPITATSNTSIRLLCEFDSAEMAISYPDSEMSEQTVLHG